MTGCCSFVSDKTSSAKVMVRARVEVEAKARVEARVIVMVRTKAMLGLSFTWFPIFNNGRRSLKSFGSPKSMISYQI